MNADADADTNEFDTSPYNDDGFICMAETGKLCQFPFQYEGKVMKDDGLIDLFY